ncbi:sucrase ferredoxin [Frankia nepalensis]|nr:sucrase ferredoxin [Frankia nepalensis]
MQSRSAAEELRGVIPDLQALALMPVPAPWPEDVDPGTAAAVGLPPLSRAKTLYYRPYPGRPTDDAPFFWDVTSRAIHRQNADGAWAPTEPTAAPQFIGVCIHGRKDVCCGTRGGAFMRRVQKLAPGAPVYGVSHLGGDRFSVNAVVLPSGYLLGRVDDLDDEALLDLLETGLLPLSHVRGRLGSTPAEAVAEIWYRERFARRDPGGMPTVKAVSPVEQAPDRHEVLVTDANRRFRLDLGREQQGDTPIHYTCAADRPSPVYRWDVRLLDEATGSS